MPAEGALAIAYSTYLRDVFGAVPKQRPSAEPAWVPFAYFEVEGRCVAGIETALLRLVTDGHGTGAAAIRLAGVVPSHRGHGLFRDLMGRALAWCAGQTSGPVLLYTEAPTLYTRFGFRPLAQHAFVGPVPVAAPVEAAESVDRARMAHLLDQLTPSRTPVSHACAIAGGSDLLRANLDDDTELGMAYSAELEALIVHEVDGPTLVLVDLVAAAMPSMSQIVGALRTTCSRVRTLFPTDRLDWQGAAELEDTGLMARGRLPAAMTRPFMLPPTTGF